MKRQPKKVNANVRVKLLLEAIEQQREKLADAISLLACMQLAMEHTDGDEDFTFKGPFYPAIARIVLEMVAKSHDALDSINLPRGELLTARKAA